MTVLSCNQITESPDPKMASASGFELYLTKYEVSMLSRLKYKCPWQKGQTAGKTEGQLERLNRWMADEQTGRQDCKV